MKIENHTIRSIAIIILLVYLTIFLLHQSVVYAEDSTVPIQTPVLVIAYYPPDTDNPQFLDQEETGWTIPVAITTLEGKTEEMIQKHISFLADATRYHGYKDENAPSSLTYNVYNRLKFYEKIPRGHLLKPETMTYRPYYRAILENINICDTVDNHTVKEVWMFGYHSAHIEPDESRMGSKLGDIANSWPKEEYLEEKFRIPVCANTYVLYNFTYNTEATITYMVHNRMHQIENVMSYIDPAIFWHDFSEWVQDGTDHNYNSSCGNGHYTPNWQQTSEDQNIDDDYNYSISEYRLNNCETWHPDDSQTSYISANCSRWGCTDVGFYKWFMQNLPGYQNGIVYQGKTMRNWWEAMYDLQEFVRGGRSLYETTEIKPIIPTPTSSISTINPTGFDFNALWLRIVNWWNNAVVFMRNLIDNKS
ncbi:hypothetical protein HY468_05675 [Candidatus Roizmanbacteria bacterium]|nr:hypothetical protein [Candidatus Roizmanbacteria bacterium]